MNRIRDIVLTDLRAEIAALGTGGGAIGPSCYDTAQVLRYAPPAEGIWPALDWLISQQGPDGGWGDPLIPRSRTLPTLATVLALQQYCKRASAQASLQAGLAFLQRQIGIWATPLPEDLPVGVELLLPQLLAEATERGLDVGAHLYIALSELGQRRRRQISPDQVRAGTTLAYSWEALGLAPDPAFLDSSGGIGHSPAATAAWLHATANDLSMAEHRSAALHYLQRAARATGSGIPGVVPTAWPIPRFEQAFALYALLSADLLDYPTLQDVLRPQINDLARGMRSVGVGFSDNFTPDGDDTACALAVMRAAKLPYDAAVLERFAHVDHFCAYPGELQESLSVTAHALHALSICGKSHAAAQHYLLARQGIDGRWSGDKWNGSWLYTTSQVLLALKAEAPAEPHIRAMEAIVVNQNADGGWGASSDQTSNREETAYALLALHALRHHDQLRQRLEGTLPRAAQWMLQSYRPFYPDRSTRWLAKTMYRPLRIARMFELAATLISLEYSYDLDAA